MGTFPGIAGDTLICEVGYCDNTIPLQGRSAWCLASRALQKRDQSEIICVALPIPRLRWKLLPFWCCPVSPGPPACKDCPLETVVFKWCTRAAILELQPPPVTSSGLRLGRSPSELAPSGCGYPKREQWRCCSTTPRGRPPHCHAS